MIFTVLHILTCVLHTVLEHMALRSVIDTNILIVSISDRSPYHWIYDGLHKGLYSLLISTQIALEYEEVIGQKMGQSTASDVIEALERLSNVLLIPKYYQWNMIKSDPDDNKFTDCAVGGRADCIVTYDKHFKVLNQIHFPSISAVTPEEFKILLNSPSL